MKRLTTFQDNGMALELQRALEEAGISATITTESTDFWSGRFLYIVWVAQDADPAAVNLVCAAVQSQAPIVEDLPPTRVDPTEDRGTLCRACGYDLRGQLTDGKCPECSHPYRVVRQAHCPACGADTPGDFDVCWQCGGELDPQNQIGDD